MGDGDRHDGRAGGGAPGRLRASDQGRALRHHRFGQRAEVALVGRRRGGDAGGAAVVDFVLISTLLVFLLFGVLQVAVYFYARNVAAASAADAARYAAAEGVSPSAGATRASGLIRQGLDDADASGLHCTSGLTRD